MKGAKTKTFLANGPPLQFPALSLLSKSSAFIFLSLLLKITTTPPYPLCTHSSSRFTSKGEPSLSHSCLCYFLS